MSIRMAFDSSSSARWKDESGYLHVDVSHITKATVNPYYGSEIPGCEELRLEKDKIYMGLRDPEELKKSLNTWKGLPLHIEHHIDSASNPQKLTRVGSIGTDIVWNDPYVDAPLTIWDGEAIKAIESGKYKELSCAYRYEPDFKAGVFKGKKYDFVMRNIRGNHVALVEEGRAGPDVVVADSALKKKGADTMNPEEEKKNAGDPQDVEQKEVDLAQSIIDLHKVDPDTGKIVDVTEDEDKLEVIRQIIDSISDEVDPKVLAKLKAAIEELRGGGEAEDEDEDAEEDDFGDEDSEDDSDDEYIDDEDEEPEDDDSVEEDEELDAEEDDEQPEEDGEEEEGKEDYSEAMGAVGLDADDPEETAAFAKGVKVGKAKAAKQKPVRKNAFDEGVKYGKKLAAGLQKKQDKEDARNAVAAQDRAIRRVKASAVAEAKAHFKALYKAAESVKPLVGSLDAMSFDSADSIYRYTLKHSGVNPAEYPRSAWRGMVDMLQRQKTTKFAMANDARPVRFDGHFSNLSTIKVNN